VIRVPTGEEGPIKKALDIGADGIIVPMVNSARAAEKVVQLCKYPPVGRRGVGYARAHGYGRTFESYMDRANDTVAVIVQAEHIEAVENIDEIVDVPGVDAVLVGPYDLSASMGKTGQVTDPEVLEAIAQVRTACESAQMSLGIFAGSADAAQPFVQQGYTLIAAGTDALFLINAADNLMASLGGR
jgi:2-dehydro-3-deoxyglucarate aldolase/4-hydroxy-2-oxoheptanedioate aldolase